MMQRRGNELEREQVCPLSVLCLRGSRSVMTQSSIAASETHLSPSLFFSPTMHALHSTVAQQRLPRPSHRAHDGKAFKEIDMHTNYMDDSNKSPIPQDSQKYANTHTRPRVSSSAPFRFLFLLPTPPPPRLLLVLLILPIAQTDSFHTVNDVFSKQTTGAVSPFPLSRG